LYLGDGALANNMCSILVQVTT